jgi:serine phosphatase RsbU (regulator of sigma subunit)
MKYHHDLPMADLCKQIFSALEEFGEGAAQTDDISMVVVKRDPLE